MPKEHQGEKVQCSMATWTQGSVERPGLACGSRFVWVYKMKPSNEKKMTQRGEKEDKDESLEDTST